MIYNFILVFFLVLNVNAKPLLYDFQKRETSQFGEDGIIEKIYKEIGFGSNVFLEFGGYTGKLSNSEYMMKKYNSFGVFIEGDHENCLKLKDYMKNYKSLVLEDFVEAEKPNTLEDILIRNNIDFNIDLLSIDIDGNDYWILNSLDKLKPRVIVCEYNFTIPSHVDIYQNYLPGQTWTFGSSIKSLTRIAKDKGYTLVAATIVNAFFIRNDLMPKLKKYNLKYDSITSVNKSRLAYCIIDPRGDYLIVSSKPNVNELEAFPYFYGFTGKKVDKKDYVKTDNIIIWDNFIVEKIADN